MRHNSVKESYLLDGLLDGGLCEEEPCGVVPPGEVAVLLHEVQLWGVLKGIISDNF